MYVKVSYVCSKSTDFSGEQSAFSKKGVKVWIPKLNAVLKMWYFRAKCLVKRGTFNTHCNILPYNYLGESGGTTLTKSPARPRRSDL